MLDDRTQYVCIGQLLASLSDGRLPEVNVLNFWAVFLARFSGQIFSIWVKILSNVIVIASRNVKKEEALFLFYVRRF